MAKGIFPPMSPTEIINAFAGWGISVSPEQLKSPTPDFVEGVFSACLHQITGLNHDVLREPVQASLDGTNTEDRELFSSSLTSNILLYHLSRFAKAARVEDFNASDVYSPERERTTILLSAFINFVKFTEQYCDAFLKELRENSDGLIIQRDNVVDQIHEVQDHIKSIKARIEQDKPIVDQLVAQNEGLKRTMFQTKDAQTHVVDEVEERKAERNAIIKRKEALHGEIKSVEDAITRARSRIVQSPERIKKTISTMTTNATEDKKRVASHEAKIRDLQGKINALHNIETEVRGCIEQIQTIEREVEALDSAKKSLGQLHDLLDAKSIERNELQMRQERVNDQRVNVNVKLERAQKHAEEKRLASQRTLERLKEEYSNMSEERRENDKEIERVREEANEVENEMNEHLRKSETELNELLAEYWKLRHQTDVYMETLAVNLNMRVIAD